MGKNIDEQIKYNFSMTQPEGYRKTLRLMKQAEKFRRPIICFVDTIGACPNATSEARGQASAISNNIISMLSLKVPIISFIVGNACSGGALALCIADRILMLDNASFTVISPRAYAEIVWKDTTKVSDAKNAMRLSANILVKQGVIDLLFPLTSNINDNPTQFFFKFRKIIIKEIKTLRRQSMSKLLKKRTKKFRSMGLYKK